MDQKRKSAVVCILILCSFGSFGQPAQKPAVSSNSREKATAALSNQQQHALGTIKELFAVSKGIRNEAARIRTGAQIADVLWDYDQPHAREYFRELLHQLDPTQPARDDSGLPPAAKSQLRRAIMAMIARHDPTMAERLLETYRKSEKTNELDPSLYPETAANIAASDLQRAITILRRSLSERITPEFMNSLRAIRESSPATANELFYQAMTLSAANDSEAFGKSLPLLASYVFPVQSNLASSSLEQNGSNSQEGDSGNGNPSAPPADIELINNFLNFAFQALLPQESLASQGPSGPGLPAYAALLQLLPYYEQYLPQQASVIVEGFNRLAAAVRDPAKRALLVNLVGQVTPNQIVQGGATLVKSDEKDIVFHRASLQASRHGDFEQALSIAGSIQDEQLRRNAESVARTEQAASFLSKGDLDDAYTAILSIPLLRQQAAMFAQIMRALIKKKDIFRAAQILDNATRVMEKAPDTPDKVSALLLLCQISSQIDGSQGTTILQLAVSAINSFDRVDNAKRDALGTPVSPDAKRAEAATNLPGFNFQGSFGLLARADFDTALALAQSIRPQELSIGAQIAACQGILNHKEQDPEKRPVSGIRSSERRLISQYVTPIYDSLGNTVMADPSIHSRLVILNGAPLRPLL
jgi:hypothetical protein